MDDFKFRATILLTLSALLGATPSIALGCLGLISIGAAIGLSLLALFAILMILLSFVRASGAGFWDWISNPLFCVFLSIALGILLGLNGFSVFIAYAATLGGIALGVPLFLFITAFVGGDDLTDNRYPVRVILSNTICAAILATVSTAVTAGLGLFTGPILAVIYFSTLIGCFAFSSIQLFPRLFVRADDGYIYTKKLFDFRDSYYNNETGLDYYKFENYFFDYEKKEYYIWENLKYIKCTEAREILMTDVEAGCMHLLKKSDY